MALSPEQELIELVASYHDDPLGFVMAAFPWGEPGPLQHYSQPDTWQVEFLQELGEEIRKRNFNGHDAVAPIQMTRSSGHGIGKGVLTAMLTAFIMSTRPNAVGSITANSYPQLETKTWAAIQRWIKLCITRDWFEVSGSLMYEKKNRAAWFVAPLSCAEENSQSFAGQHNANSTSFYIIDEGSNVPDAIYQVADGGLTDGEPMIFVFGNPTRREGKFYRINFGAERHRWLHKAIDSRTCQFTNKELIKTWEEDWGEDSDRFRVQVKGLPPSASDVQFISTAIVAEAQRREAFKLRNDPIICGLDVARGGTDNCVFRFRQGLDARSIPAIVITGKEAKDSTVLVNKAADLLMNGVPCPGEIQDSFGRAVKITRRLHIDMMFIDGTGLGGPIADQLKNLNFEKRVTEIQFAAAAPNTEGFQACGNMRSWMWEQMRVWLNKGAIDASSDLESDLTGPMYFYNTKNQLMLEDKKAIKKRLGTAESSGSPDNADSLALSFARPVAPTKTQRQIEAEEEHFAGVWGLSSDNERVWG